MPSIKVCSDPARFSISLLNASFVVGRLPDDPVVLEKEIDGIGRYTAGAICSMAYGIRTPIVGGTYRLEQLSSY